MLCIYAATCAVENKNRKLIELVRNTISHHTGVDTPFPHSTSTHKPRLSADANKKKRKTMHLKGSCHCFFMVTTTKQVTRFRREQNKHRYLPSHNNRQPTRRRAIAGCPGSTRPQGRSSDLGDAIGHAATEESFVVKRRLR